MKTLTQKFIEPNGDTFSVTHIYSESGYFEKDGLNQGWHIEFGTGADMGEYREVKGTALHNVPESLPDIYLPEEEIEDEDATIEDYEQALSELGVNIDEEN